MCANCWSRYVLRYSFCGGGFRWAGRALGLPGELSPGRAAFWRQVCWRDFYHHHLARHPEVARQALRADLRRVRWDDDPADLEAWARGETGYPVVDAGMRQLAEQGWVHNRARMIVASFLVAVTNVLALAGRSAQDRAAARRQRQTRRVKRDGDGEVRSEPAVPAFVSEPGAGGRRPPRAPRARAQRPPRRGGGGFSRVAAVAALLIAVAVVVVLVLKLTGTHHSAPARGPLKEKTTNVTIIPGDTRRKLDALLRSQGVKGSYYRATRSSPLLSPQSYGAPANIHSLEGFLFPDTYNLREPISITALVNDQLTEFRKVWPTVNLSYARAHHLTAYDVLIIASMVEGEAARASDRPLVASVIYNRLARGMPLQIDATTRYATGNYTSPLTQKQLNSPSPYNTRIHTGLPPTPIDSPGLASIQAAAHPAQTDYVYFVVKPCGNGALEFTSNYQQFLTDSAAYQQERAKLGRSPTHC